MAFKAATGFIDLKVNTKGLVGSTSAISQAMNGVRIASKAAFGAIAVGAVAAGLAVRKAFRETAEYEQALARLSSVNKATGEAAGFTTQQLIGQAEALAKVTKFSDSAVLGVQSILATFVDVRGINFTEATETILDLATVMGTDARSAAIQLGKVLADPVAQMNALTRSGVTFNQEAKDIVKNLVAMGKLGEAQQFILGGIKSQGISGSAQAAGATGTGGFTRLMNEVGTAFRVAGQQMLESFGPLIEMVKRFIPLIETSLPTAINSVVDWFVGLVNSTADLVGGWENLLSIIDGVMIGLANFKTLLVTGFMDLFSNLPEWMTGVSSEGWQQAIDEGLAGLAQKLADSELAAQKRANDRAAREANRNNANLDKVNAPFALGTGGAGSRSSGLGKFTSIADEFNRIQSSLLGKDPTTKAIQEQTKIDKEQLKELKKISKGNPMIQGMMVAA